MSKQPVRRLRTPHIHNLRDLGGYIGDNNRIVKWNCLYRGGSLHNAEREDWSMLKEAGVMTVMDLRSEAETRQFSYRVPEGIAYVHSPMQRAQIDFNRIEESAAEAFAKSLKDGYCAMVREDGDLLANALHQLTERLNRGAVLFHCSAGKDRTGILAAAVLWLCGVEDEDIAADYQVSYTYNKKGINLLVGGQYEKLMPMIRSDAENMENLLEYFREINLSEYLEERGFPEDEQKELVRLLLR
ncbi:tyrosine-protein phosphatase [Clostridium sp. AM58-1XD]|uniref:tyrosine-protein phosphatase n=1 Tax=Clostridium sp. AM58-1XD TaxID=2292307 RepID=UPI000E4C3B0B|nr:tyrosine-protein phosphatase [Clostridium sp. AM58-1XD]RGY97346.1 protein-tyrosine-phosphatase [Clostridium sp. AM58-1XD]